MSYECVPHPTRETCHVIASAHLFKCFAKNSGRSSWKNWRPLQSLTHDLVIKIPCSQFATHHFPSGAKTFAGLHPGALCTGAADKETVKSPLLTCASVLCRAKEPESPCRHTSRGCPVRKMPGAHPAPWSSQALLLAQSTESITPGRSCPLPTDTWWNRCWDQVWKFAWKPKDARSCMQGTLILFSGCCVYHSSNRHPKVGWKETNELTLHAREPLLEGHLCDLWPINLMRVRTWLPGAGDLWYRDGAASYQSWLMLTPGPLQLWKYPLLCTLLSLYFDSKVETVWTMGLEKLNIKDRLSFAPWNHPNCVQHSSGTWRSGAGSQSAAADVGREDKGKEEESSAALFSVNTILDLIRCFNWRLTMRNMPLGRNLHLLL